MCAVECLQGCRIPLSWIRGGLCASIMQPFHLHPLSPQTRDTFLGSLLHRENFWAYVGVPLFGELPYGAEAEVEDTALPSRHALHRNILGGEFWALGTLHLPVGVHRAWLLESAPSPCQTSFTARSVPCAATAMQGAKS